MIITNIQYNNETCNPLQIINVNNPITDPSKLQIFNINNEEVDKNCLQFSYSLDSICWSCYMSYNDLLKNTLDLGTDFYVRFKINSALGDLYYDGEQTPYSSQLSGDFSFTDCANGTTSSNMFNPYANMDDAINLQSSLAETVSCLFGIPIYYFKLKPNAGSADYTFKEYALMGVESVKQIKLMIADGTMPSSKPEFADFGLEFQTDWETEITKASFATAFGINAQPMEGDFIYIPMMKRMWMVTGAYEEKNGNLMWNATTFKVMLVKYQEKGSVDLQDTEELVNSLVKNKYEDLFGDDVNTTLDSGESTSSATEQAANALYPVYKSDAMRKYVTCDTIKIVADTNLYFRGTLLADSKYTFIRQDISSKVIYQNKYCGCNASISFIIKPEITPNFKGTIMKVGNVEIKIDQDGMQSSLYLNTNKYNKLVLESASTYFIVIRWCKSMNLMDMSAYLYKVTNENIPIYKLTSAHYFFDIDNPIGQISDEYNEMCEDTEGHDVYVSNFYGTITNIKVFDVYNDNISELLQMFPTHQHMLINDTARFINGMQGVQI